jgi:protein-S-isoprenylcysteine O-methyltransferase Ste14
MTTVLPFCIHAAWLTLGLVWVVAAMAVKRTVRAEPLDSRAGHLITFAVAFTLLFSSRLRIGPLAWRVVPSSEALAAAGLALTIGGIFFAIWARFYLGGNWSAMVTIKQQHTLIRTGPYAIVRHPIYAGLLLAMFGTALEVSELRGFLAVVLAFAAWLAKSRLEESFLLAQFGEAYLHYRQEVKSLVPFVL